jgi:hypothetical protein
MNAAAVLRSLANLDEIIGPSKDLATQKSFLQLLRALATRQELTRRDRWNVQQLEARTEERIIAIEARIEVSRTREPR